MSALKVTGMTFEQDGVFYSEVTTEDECGCKEVLVSTPFATVREAYVDMRLVICELQVSLEEDGLQVLEQDERVIQ